MLQNVTITLLINLIFMFSTGRLLFNHIIGLLLSLYFLKCHLSDHRQIFFLSQLSVNHIRNLLHGFWTNVTFIYQSSKMCNKLFSDFTESFPYFILFIFFACNQIASHFTWFHINHLFTQSYVSQIDSFE